MPDSDELLRRQSALQAQADDVERDLRLGELTSCVGAPVRVGSSALGLMVWPDLDLTVVCPTLDATEVAGLGARLGIHRRIRQVVFRNDTGAWNTDPAYPDGLYLGLSYRASDGADWKIDIWFVDQPDRQPDLQHLRTISARLTDQTREAILQIKHAWCRRPEYGTSVTSFDIYSAVLDGDVRTAEQFDRWRAARTR